MSVLSALDSQIISTLMDYIPEGIIKIDLSGVIVKTNRAGKKWAKQNKLTELTGFHYLDLVHDSEKERIYQKFQESILGNPVHFKFNTHTNHFIKATFVPIILEESAEPDSIICIIQDVTSNVLLRDRIKEDRSKFKITERLVQLGYCEFDLVKRTGWASEKYYDIFGFDKNNRVITVDRWLETLHPEDRAKTHQVVKDTIAGDQNEIHLSYRIISSNQEVRNVQSIVIIIRDHNRTPIKLNVIVKDDTERANAIQTLMHNERILSKAQEMAKIGSWKCDLKTGRLEWSDETYKLFELPVGTPMYIAAFENYIHKEDREFVDKSWQAAINGVPYDLTYRVIVNGAVKWVREQAEFESDNNGERQIGIGTIQDISDLRDLHNANQIFNQSQAMSGIGSWRYNVRNRELYWSDSVYHLFGINKQEHPRIFYEDYLNAIHPEDIHIVKESSEATAKTKESFELTYRVNSDKGQYKWILEKGDLLCDDSGEITEMYGIVRDVTEEHNTMLELIKARQRAEESDAIKDEFLSVMSHEVRTPLNSVIGLSNLLLRRNPKPEQMEILKTLKGSADNLLHLVNDILDFNKIKAGKLELEFIAFEVDSFLQQLHSSFKLFAQDKGLDFQIQMDPRVPAQLIGDITRLNQIFNNLLNNAIKFTQSGFVRLTVGLKEIEADTCTLVFEVEDSGVGIASDKQHIIFNPFQQSEVNITRQFGGTGLGLSIVKNLVEIMKGNIYLKSHPGKGTTFTLEFRFNYLNKNTEPEDIAVSNIVNPHPAQEQQYSVLYVEDVMSNRFLIENLLGDNHIKCTSVSSGKEALKLTASQKYDVILMDLQMPEMDGYQTTGKIRNQAQGKNRRTPIIAFTAKPYSESLKEDILKHGIQDLMNKPFDVDSLLEKVNTLASLKEVNEVSQILSFKFYERIFEKDLSKLKEIKATVIKEFKQFERKLYQHCKAKNLQGIREEVHKMRPIMKNLEYHELYNLLENPDWPKRYTVKIDEWVTEVRKLTRLGTKELENIDY